MNNDNLETKYSTILLLIIAFVLSTFDYIETIFFISQLGIAVEGNPVARLLFEHNCAWVGKFIILPVLLWSIYHEIKKNDALFIGAVIVVALFFWVVIHNLIQIDKAGLSDEFETFLRTLDLTNIGAW